jgi:hypothetical protein
MNDTDSKAVGKETLEKWLASNAVSMVFKMLCVLMGDERLVKYGKEIEVLEYNSIHLLHFGVIH